MNVSFLVHRWPRNSRTTFWRKLLNWKKVLNLLKNWIRFVFLFWNFATVCRRCYTFWEPVHVLIIKFSGKRMTKTYATGCPKRVTWISTIFRVLRWLLSAVNGLGILSVSLIVLPALWPKLLVRMIPSMMFCSQKRMRNGWVCRMNRQVLSMEPRSIGPNLCTSKPPKIWFLEWMTNVRKFLMPIKV